MITSKNDAVKIGAYSYTEKKGLDKPVKPNKKELRALEKAKKIAFNDSVEKSKIKVVVEEETPQDFTPTFEVSDYIKHQILNVAAENLGSPYRGGGSSPAGFDCSGFVNYTLSQFDIELPRSSHEMARSGKRILKSEAKAGDLIFFNTSGGGVSHVGIVTENSDGIIKFIHSSTSSGVIYSSTAENYYARTFVGVNRILE
ncbi:C40 family peptidase [Flavobacterium sp. F372]|uniref:C40 family peptidase n=1 Tax=Flavobacterium bernardetii TaxID=2813823 RepID=A0ABR7J0Y2_9FLAO|nr:C40 family peptidase [Flavobacterium bernardetii]NHF71049.1 C40 family peptidase [Flavobacterium bernardetii]